MQTTRQAAAGTADLCISPPYRAKSAASLDTLRSVDIQRNGSVLGAKIHVRCVRQRSGLAKLKCPQGVRPCCAFCLAAVVFTSKTASPVKCRQTLAGFCLKTPPLCVLATVSGSWPNNKPAAQIRIRRCASGRKFGNISKFQPDMANPLKGGTQVAGNPATRFRFDKNKKRPESMSGRLKNILRFKAIRRSCAWL